MEDTMASPLPALIRVAGHADVLPAVDIWRQANTARGKPPSHDRITRVHAKLTEPTSLVLVAFHAGDPIGMALAEPGCDLDGTGLPLTELCHISMVFVHPHHWGRRVGQQLLEAIARHAAHRGHTCLQLWTGAANRPAQRLYQRAGFQPSGRTKELATGESIVHLIRRLPGMPTYDRWSSMLGDR
ncbi:GNAT family N-acetyltransferase [Amycolatopsis sp. NPDC058278]|uniref:GNAT family N-acetyltransferase n=1 Tax=Amycolatopsis sp. NPDC058278 TaxID=3346417 RepID=UPI0036D93BB3